LLACPFCPRSSLGGQDSSPPPLNPSLLVLLVPTAVCNVFFFPHVCTVCPAHFSRRPPLSPASLLRLPFQTPSPLDLFAASNNREPPSPACYIPCVATFNPPPEQKDFFFSGFVSFGEWAPFSLLNFPARPAKKASLEFAFLFPKLVFPLKGFATSPCPDPPLCCDKCSVPLFFRKPRQILFYFSNLQIVPCSHT